MANGIFISFAIFLIAWRTRKIIKNSYLLVKGSIVGPKKRAIILTKAIRVDKKVAKDGLQVNYVSLRK